MLSDPTPYIKTFDDELDWKQLDQLHHVVSQISSFCFETKKFCVTTLFVVLTLMVKFTSDKLDHSIFMASLLIPVCFWFLDAVAYYYQVKLRGMMEGIRVRLSERNAKPLIQHNGTSIIEQGRIQKPWYQRAVQAGFNHSMWLYPLLVVFDSILWVLFAKGLI